jgi:hypothetical protein
MNFKGYFILAFFIKFILVHGQSFEQKTYDFLCQKKDSILNGKHVKVFFRGTVEDSYSNVFMTMAVVGKIPLFGNETHAEYSYIDSIFNIYKNKSNIEEGKGINKDCNIKKRVYCFKKSSLFELKIYKPIKCYGNTYVLSEFCNVNFPKKKVVVVSFDEQGNLKENWINIINY